MKTFIIERTEQYSEKNVKIFLKELKDVIIMDKQVQRIIVMTYVYKTIGYNPFLIGVL